MDENGLSHAQDETGIVPSILNALLIKGIQGKLICFNIKANLLKNSNNNVTTDLAQHLMTEN